MLPKKGDQVRFLNTIGGGVVTRVVDLKKVVVEDEDGFENVMQVSELVVIGEYKPASTANQSNKTITESVAKPGPEKNIEVAKQSNPGHKPLFAILPKGDLSSFQLKFELYLLNDAGSPLLFIVYTEKSGKYTLLESGELEGDTSIQLGVFAKSKVQEINSIHIQMLLIDMESSIPKPPVEYRFLIDGMNIAKSTLYSENDFFDEKAIVIDILKEITHQDYHLADDKIKQIIFEKDLKPEVKKVEALEPMEQMEVDLHIEELVENHSGMLPGEIIQIQLARFETALETAQKSKVKKLVLIHGVGNGKLKLEVRKTLDTKYPRFKYQDASFAEYGFGATLVFLR